MKDRWKGLSRGQKVWATLGLVVVLLLGLLVFPAAAWFVGTEGIVATSDSEYCGGCHTMEQFVKANGDSVHGGDNQWGIKAECVDCHLPHNNSFNYLISKVRRGSYDIWYEVFHDTSNIDWKAKDDAREEFVFDSGCITCHDQLHAATLGFPPHDNYFAGVTDSKCVTCHNDIGHSNVNMYQLEHKYKH